MLGQPKPFASLSSGLLARKGHAKPAMRPQGFGGFGAASLEEDLGWNDMGDGHAAAPKPPVLIAREQLAAEVEAPAPVAEPAPEAVAPVAPAPAAEAVAPAAAIVAHPVAPATVERIGRESRRTGKAAFTLRLEADRHLRLRLASAVAGRSAQAIMIGALDAFLATVPEVEELAGQLGRAATATTRDRLGD
jgi:hypothetical protein